MKINITVHGKGKPLVLFHGWGFDSQVWKPLIPVLHEQYTLYLVDLPGFGLSVYMSWDDFKAYLLKQLPDIFILIGWSMGGLFATRLAIEEPARVSHLVNIASSPRFIKDKDWPGIEKDAFTSFYNNLMSTPDLVLRKFVSLQLKGEYTLPIEQFQPAPIALKEGLHLLANWDLRESLLIFNKPTCYIFGRLDAITQPKTMKNMQIDYPDFTYYMFHRAAHVPFLSHTEEFIEALENFLS